MEYYDIWVEKYRPRKLSDMIISDNYRNIFNEMIKNKKLSGHLLFYGRAGIGKTTLAKVLANELNSDLKFINASDERSIDVVREKIKTYSSIMLSPDKNNRIILLDEVDNFTIDAFKALRAEIESLPNDIYIIATCNYIQKIPEPIQSRLQSFLFDPISDEIGINYLVNNILKNENIEFDIDTVKKIYRGNHGDFRKIINSFQRLIVNSKLVLTNNINLFDDFTIIYQLKDISKLKEYLANNNIDYVELYRFLYDKINNPEKMIILGEYLFRDSQVIDKEISFVACICRLWQMK